MRSWLNADSAILRVDSASGPLLAGSLEYMSNLAETRDGELLAFSYQPSSAADDGDQDSRPEPRQFRRIVIEKMGQPQ